jgi:Protein of unknown function (DUF2934)
MAHPTDEQIRIPAHQLWEQSGKPIRLFCQVRRHKRAFDLSRHSRNHGNDRGLRRFFSRPL